MFRGAVFFRTRCIAPDSYKHLTPTGNITYWIQYFWTAQKMIPFMVGGTVKFLNTTILLQFKSDVTKHRNTRTAYTACTAMRIDVHGG